MKPGPQLAALRLRPRDVVQAVTSPATFDVGEMRRWVDHDSHEMRAELRAFLDDDLFLGRYHDTLDQMREIALKRLQKLFETPGRFVAITDFETDPRRIFAAHEITCQVDGSFATKLTVQVNLMGGTVLKLGTERHRAHVERLDRLQDIGCFCLTEVGAGNAAATSLGTTAVYDAAAKEFVIDTPDTASLKYWITNGALDSNMAVVFARTFVAGKYEGVHGFLVRIRDDKHRPARGVTIEDMGRKLGQQGVDNAKIGFRQVRVPRESLLNRYADVNEKGEFVCSIKAPRARFLAALNQLLSGRLCLSSKGVGRAKQALVIAVRYSLSRLSTGASGEADTPIMFNGLQQRALIPLIARTYAVSCVGMSYVKDRFASETTANGSRGLGAISPELEILCSGIKALNTWHVERVVSVARERMGGAGYLSANKFEEMLGDAHAIMTAEGDNSVLMMKVAKERLGWAKTDKGAFVAKALVPYTGFEDVRSLEYLLHVFVKREAVMMVELQGIMDRDMRLGASLHEVWSVRESDRVQALAKAYVERVCLEQFLARIRAAPKTIAPMLEQLAVLFALDVIERDAGWFLTHRVLTLEQVSTVSLVARDMCLALTPQAIHLVESFSVPEHLLVPAGRDWIKYNSVATNGEVRGFAF